MAVPRNRVSNARKNIRRSHHALKKQNLVGCSKCGTTRRPHTICQNCGHYGDLQLVEKTSEE